MDYRYAREIIRSILMEQASQNYVVDAIKKKYEADITYDDEASGTRRIQPVAYGKSKKGNLVLRAYQVQGATESESPGWKLFRLDKIMSWNPVKDSNFGEPPGMNGWPKYNEKGDNSMSEIYLMADFGNGTAQPTETAPQEPVSTPTVQAQKSDIAGIGDDVASKQATNSISDMQKANSFTNSNATQTVGPVTKDGNESNGQIPKEGGVNYREINSGPEYKQEKETPFDNLNYVSDQEEENNEEEETI